MFKCTKSDCDKTFATYYAKKKHLVQDHRDATTMFKCTKLGDYEDSEYEDDTPEHDDEEGNGVFGPDT
jgi:hypothetical protein